MEKFQIKNATCIRTQGTENGSNVTFAVKKEKQQSAQPGQPQQLAVRNAITINCEGSEAKQFEEGKKYTISVEAEE